MKKILIPFILAMLLLVTQVSAVTMFVNWPDGSTAFQEIHQGNDISFNYESFDFDETVTTQVYLINAIDPYNPVSTLVDTVDYQGDYGYITFPTDGLPAGEYAIYGEASVPSGVSVAEIGFSLKPRQVPNTPPYFDFNIPDYFEYYLSEQNDTLFNIANYANDDEGDTLSYTLDQSNTNTNVVQCNLYFQSSIFCEFIGVGITTIDVIVSDGELSSSHTVTINILDDGSLNTAPYFFNLPSPYIYNLSEGTVNVVQLSDYAFDNEGDSLSFTVTGGDNVVDCFVNTNDVLVCDLLNAGNTDLTVTVSDGSLQGTDTITIIVLDDSVQNTAPYFWNLPDYFEYPVSQGTADLLDLADYAIDAEGDDLIYTLEENIPGIACYIIDGSVIRCDFNQVTQGQFVVTVSDGEFSDSEIITIVITDDPVENTAPFWSGLPFNYAYNIDQGSAYVVQLSDYAFDLDGDVLSFILDESATNANIIDCLIDSNSYLICFFEGELGTTTVDVVVSDGELSDTQTLTIEIYEISTPPVWSNQLELFYSFDIDESPVNVFNALDFVTDADGDNIDIILDETNTNLGIINCFLSGSQESLVCLLNGLGTTTVDLIATDGDYNVPITVTIEVTDQPVNQPPVWDNDLILFYSYDIDESPVTLFDAVNFVSDPDGDNIVITLDESQTDLGIVNCFLSGSQESLVCLLNGVGTTTVDLVASDGEFDVDITVVIEVTQEMVNQPPYWSNNLDLFYSYDIDESPVSVVNLANFAIDPDGDAVDVTLDESQTDLGIVNCFLSGSSETLVCILNGLGITTVDVIVSDGQYDVPVTITIQVTDQVVNTAPYFVDLPDYFEYPLSQQNAYLLDLADYAVDPQGDALIYSINENIPGITCNLVGGSLIYCEWTQVTSGSFTVTVSDGQFSDTEVMTVVIYDDTPNTAPVWSNNLELFYSYDIDESPVTLFDALDYVFDAEGDNIEITLDESQTNLGIANCFLSSSQESLVCLLNGLGTTSLELIASDGEFDVPITIVIEVTDQPVNEPPYWSNQLDLFYSYDVDESPVYVVDLANFAMDPNGDNLEIILDESQTDFNVLNCFLSGSQETLICILNDVGTTTVNAIVSDGQYTDEVTITIEVTDQIVNTAPVWSNNLDLYYSYNIDESPVTLAHLQNFVSDAQGDNIEITLDESNTNLGIVNCFLSGSLDSLICLLNGVGTTSLTAIASDGEFSVPITITVNVYEDIVIENHAPVWDYDLPDYFEYDLDLGTVNVMNLANYASDVDGDALSFSLVQSGTDFSVVDCHIESGSQLVCDLNGVGTTSLDVVVSDGELTDTETITIHVYQQVINQPPYWSNNLDLFYSYDIDESPVTLFNALEFAIDPDGDNLDVTLDESNTNLGIVNCFLSGSQESLVCLLNGVGITTVDLIVSDGEYTADVTVTIEVTDEIIIENNPPQWDYDLPDYFEYNIDLNTVTVMNLANYASDVDGDALSFSLDQSNTNFGVVDCYIQSGSQLVCDLNGVGITTLNVIVSDGEFTDVESITIKVFEVDVNEPPYWSNSLDLFYSYDIEESPVSVVNFANFAIDPDGDNLDFTLDESNTNLGIVNCFLSGSQETLVCLLNGVGTTSVDVTIDDGEYTAEVTIVIQVTEEIIIENNAPYWTYNLPDYFEYNIDLESVTVMNLANYAVDPDGDALTYSVVQSGTNFGVVDCQIEFNSLLTCDLNGVGTTSVDVVVSDGEFTDIETVVIHVYEIDINEPPYWSNNLDLYYSYNIEESPVYIVNLEDYAIDPDGDNLVFTLDESNTNFGIINCFLSGSQETLVCLLNGVGTTSVTAIISDGEYTDEVSITVNVYEDIVIENHAPVWDYDLPTYFEYDLALGNVNVLNLANYASDVDGDVLTFSLDQSGTNFGVVNCYIQSNSVLACNLNGVGTTSVDVVVSDGEFTDVETVVIHVYEVEVNEPPVWSNQLDLYYSYNIDESPVYVVNILDYVSDPNGDNLDITLDESNTDFSVINCFLSGSSETLVCLLNGVGTTSVQVIASDDEYSVPVTITINVYEDIVIENNAPYWTYDLPDYFEYDLALGNVNVMDLSNYAVDPDGDALSFSLDQSGTNFGVVNCQVMYGSLLSCNLNGVGTTSVDVIVSDGEYTDTETVVIHVYEVEVNEPPYWSNSLDLFYSYDIDESPVTLFNAVDFAIDPNEDNLDFTLDESNTNLGIINCFLSGSQESLVCLLNGVGTTSVDLIVSDGEYTTDVTITVQVTDEIIVENHAPVWDYNIPDYFEYDLDLDTVIVMDLANYASDVDGDALTFSLNQANTDFGVVDCHIQSGSLLACNLNGVGFTNLNVIVSDGQLTDTETIYIKVFQQVVNNPPSWSNNLDLYYSYNIEESPVTVVQLQDVVSDPDGDTIDITLDESNTDLSIVNCFLSGSTDTLVCLLNGVGTTTVHLIASDGEFTDDITVTINVYEDIVIENNAPQWDYNIPDYFEYDYDLENVVVMNLANYATDIDGDDLFFNIDQSDTDFQVVDCTIQFGSILNCNLNGLGITDLDIIVSDGELSDVETVTIKVYEVVTNEPPYWNTSLDLFYSYDIDESPVTLFNAVDFAIDPNGDNVDFVLDESNTDLSIVNCFLSGSQESLVCLLNGLGTTTVDLIATDGEFTTDVTVTIEVTDEIIVENNPPTWNYNVPDYFEYDLALGNVNVMDLSNYASDIDGDSLTFTIDQSSTNFNVVDCQIEYSSLLTCDLNGVGITALNIIVSDGEYTDVETITIKVFEVDVNEAPYWSNQLELYYSYDIEESPVSVVNLANFAIDPDGDTIDITLDESNTNLGIVNCFLSGSTETLVCLLNGVGTTSLTAVVSDGEFTDEVTITINVYETIDPNNAPQWDYNIPDYFEYNIDLGSVNVMDLSDYAIDVDGDTLSFTIDQSNTNAGVVDCQLIYGSLLTCDLNGVGQTTLTVIVSDGELTDTHTITIKVYETIDPNQAPVWGTGLDLYYSYDIEESPVSVVNLANYVSDPDGDVVELYLDESQTNFNVMNCFLSGSSNLVCVLEGVGTTTVDVIATDGEFSVPITITINVYETVNNAPYFDNLSLEYMYNIDEQQVTVVNLANVAVDIDGDALSFYLDESNTNPGIVDCYVTSGSIIGCDLNGVGTTSVKVTVSDGQDIAQATLWITVYEDENNEPYFTASMPSFFSYPLSMQEANLFTVSNYVVDPDGDSLTYEIDESQTDFGVVDCAINEQSTISCDLNGVGTTMFTVVVSDGEFTIIRKISVEVYNDNTAPYFDANIPYYFEYDLSQDFVNVFTVADYVYDDENDPLYVSLDTTETDEHVVVCDIDATSLISCDLIGEGVTTFEVTVSDGEFTITQTVIIKVLDDVTSNGPVAVISTDGPRNSVGTPYNFNGYNSYTVPGESIVFYDWIIRNPDGDIIAQMSGPSQSYTFTEQNEYVIELTVTDTQGLTDTTMYVMQSRWAAKQLEYESEDGLFIANLEIWGYDFERVEENGQLLVVATLENVGDRDLEDVRMVFTIPELGWKVKSNAIDLDEGERETIQILDYLPDYVTEGYYYPVVSFSDTDLRRSKPMYLEVMG